MASKISTYTELIQIFIDKKDASHVVENKELEKALAEIVSKNIKPKRYEVSYTIELRSVDKKTGINQIRKLLEDIKHKGVEVLYLGAPRYRLTSEASDYPKAEGRIKEAQRLIEKQKVFAYTIKSDKE